MTREKSKLKIHHWLNGDHLKMLLYKVYFGLVKIIYQLHVPKFPLVDQREASKNKS